jgi:GDP-4-dehydro-6-deoxy-D-mannose reductase
MKTAFVTGVFGFVGRHLQVYLRENGWEVTGLDLRMSGSLAAFYRGDLHDRSAVQRALRETRPDVIFHLSGILKSENAEEYYRAHVFGTMALFDAVRETDLKPLIIMASSSAVYGAGLGRRPITEQFRPRPLTHYAVSKLAQEMVAMRYHAAFDLPVICVRMFNLLGPGLSPVMACSDFARQIALAERKGQTAVISTGNLKAYRDFVDVRDAVRAYALLAEKGRPGRVYNLASGRPARIQDCLDFLRGQARVRVEVVTDPARVQANDVPFQVGSAARLQSQTGWKAEIPLEQSLRDLLEDWRRKVETEAEPC